MSDSDDDPQTLVRVQLDLVKQVVNALRNFKKDSPERHVKSYFDVRLSNLDRLYDRFNANHSEIIQSSLSPKDKYFSDDTADKFEEEYIHAVSCITEVYNAKFPSQPTSIPLPAPSPPSNATVPHVQPSTALTTAVRLPKIAVPSFSGKYTEWPSFYDSFLRLIHSNSSIMDIEKFHFLKQSLPDDFDSDIRDLPLTSTNYTTAWETLVGRYNNNRVLFSHYMNLLSSQPTINKESATEIKHLLDTSRSCVSALRNLQIKIDECDQIIVHFLVVKLPPATHQLWEQELGKSVEIPDFKRFTDFLDIRYRILEAIEFQHNLNFPNHSGVSKSTAACHSKAHHRDNAKPTYRRESKVHHISTSQNASRQSQSNACFACKSTHLIRRCPKFLAMDCFERKSLADQANLCMNCLSPNHSYSACLSNKNCQQCGKRHHTLLHFPITGNSFASNQSKDPNSAQTNPVGDSYATASVNHITQYPTRPLVTHACKFTSRSEVLLPTALVEIITPSGQIFALRALLDQGSTGALISERAAQSLKLERLPIISSIKLPNGQRTSGKFVTNITIRSRIEEQCKLNVFASIVKSVTANLPSRNISCYEWPHIQGLNYADPDFHRSLPIDLLLGADTLAKVLLEGLRKGQPNEPIAQQTRFGWIVSGEAFQPTVPANLTDSIICSQVSLDQLDTLVKQFYALESIPSDQHFTQEEQWCEEFFKQTQKRQANGRYLVRLPLKSLFDTHMCLGRSKQMALNRYHSIERKLNNNSQLLEQYSAAIGEYFDLHQITPAETTEQQHRRFNSSKRPYYTCCYLPHHAVLKTDSLTTKCRVVFDASSKTSSGQSLNDLLCNGPALQNDLSAVLLNWRLHRFVITADVEKMYRCIDMDEEDSQYQRILWRNEQHEIQEYRLTTVTFGTASAPYTAIRIMHQLADDERDRYPLASNVLKREMYVDDIFTGGDTIQQVLEIRNHTQLALLSAGFKLHKWAGNVPELLRSIPLHLHSNATALEVNSDELIKTLGMCWQPNTDQFQYRLNFKFPEGPITKRSVLSTIAKLFDPLGLINPVIVVAKIFLKRLWSINLEWDEPLSVDLCKEWKSILADLPTINEISIPRWLKFSPKLGRSVGIHAFSDGSAQAYASVVYLRLQDDRNQFHTNIITAKGKVTPKQQICIPRIELCAAVLSIKLVKWVLKHLQLASTPITVFYWTDATIVLSWIRGDINRWPVFVANRIGAIHAASDINQWHHVSTHENPADHSSRGLTASQLRSSDLYWHGPQWLSEPRDKWPTSNWTFLDTENMQQIINTVMDAPEASFIQKYSTLSSLRRITAWSLRFYHNCRRSSDQRTSGTLTVQELHNALMSLVRIVQAECFQSDIRALLKHEYVSNQNNLANLTPFLDKNMVLRVGGRLQRSNLSYDEKHPIILPKDHHFTDLVIRYGHLNTLHGGIRLTSAFIRKQFWIVNAKKTIQSKLKACVICFRQRPQVSQQLMGSLPEPRVTPAFRPFLSTGIDYTGAIELKASRYRGNTTYKGYIAIFICLATKAIHLEAVTGMTADQFLCALQRFIGRRGLCHDIYSECGSNFIGADTILKNNAKRFMATIESEITPTLAEKGIQWHFNPPHSPNFGGLWEANVKSVKYHLKRTTTGTPFTYEDLSTVLIRIEACLNSRPLCPLTSNTDDLMVLTPGHFLIGDSLLAPPEPAAPEQPLHRRYFQQQRMIQQFWSRWSSDWLTHLQSRPKWCRQHDNLQIDDLVIIKDDRLPPNQWQLGRILETHPGEDKLVRVVTVRTKTGNYKRCVSKICRLPIENSLSSHE